VTAKVLTAAAIARLKPARNRIEVPDGKSGGLYLIIQPTGHKSWALRFRRPSGAKAKLTLGDIDYSGRELTADPVIGQPLTLAAARWLAADITRQRQRGIDVVAELAVSKQRHRIEREQVGENTFGTLLRKFFAEHKVHKTGQRPRRWRETARTLGLIYPADGDPVETTGGLAQRWADKPVSEIDPHHVYQVIDEARHHGIPGRERRNKGLSDPRGRALGRALSALFGWLVQHRKVLIDPTNGVFIPGPPKARDRVLEPDEVRWLWRACDQVGFPFGPLCKTLLLTGARREEVRGLTRGELSDDGALWTIPGSRTKNHLAHAVPLPPLVREIIAAAPRIENAAGLVFTTGTGAVGGFSKYKRRLDAAMLAAAREERGKDATVAPWVLHDLRRTCATGMANLGVAPHIIEAALNHVSGARAGVAGTYNRAAYAEEKRVALERWAAHVHGLISGRSANVVALPRKGA
jgi:integrase